MPAPSGQHCPPEPPPTPSKRAFQITPPCESHAKAAMSGLLPKRFAISKVQSLTSGTLLPVPFKRMWFDATVPSLKRMPETPTLKLFPEVRFKSGTLALLMIVTLRELAPMGVGV